MLNRSCARWSVPAALLLLLAATGAHALPTVAIDRSFSVIAAREGGSTPIKVRIERASADGADLAVPLTVKFRITPDTDAARARLVGDVFPVSATIPADATFVDVELTPRDNAVREGHLRLTLTLEADSAYNLAPQDGANPAPIALDFFVNDDETLPTLRVRSSATVLVENSQNNFADITFVLTGDTSNAFAINYTATGLSPRVTLNGSGRFDANRIFSSMSLGVNNDAGVQGDTVVTITLQESPYYLLAKDPSGAIVNASVSVIIQDDDFAPPQANFLLDQVVEQGDTALVKVVLSGTPTHYPIRIPISGGSIGLPNVDFIAPPSEIVISSGTEGVVELRTLRTDDGVDKPVQIDMGQPINARLGQFISHTVIITQKNIMPAVSLQATQDGRDTRTVVSVGGPVTVTASVTDVNAADRGRHLYNWDATNAALRPIGGGNGTNTFTFDPRALAPGLYQVRLTVTDTGSPPASTTVQLQLEVLGGIPTLSANDSDSDNIADSVEGFGDDDNDGIPNFLDSSQVELHELQQREALNIDFVIRTRPGLALSLGDTAAATGRYSALVSVPDVGLYGGGEGRPGPNSTDNFSGSGGFFDFVVKGLTVNSRIAPTVQSVPIVIPQALPIPARAVYRQYTPETGWRNFIVTDRNQIASAPDRNGSCPLPGDAAYVLGLTEGHTCVQLRIEDNGPNDADISSVNFEIRNLGGIGLSPQAEDNPGARGPCGGLFCSGGSSGGGAVGWPMALLLACYGGARLRRASRLASMPQRPL